MKGRDIAIRSRSSMLLIAALLLSGCDKPVQTRIENPSGGGAGTIEAINHTHLAINRFSVNGVNAIDIIGPYQGGGGGYGSPSVWTPGQTVRVDWVSGPAFASDVPELPGPKRPDTTGMEEEAYYQAWQDYSDKRNEWYKKFEALNKRHTQIVPVPDYTGQPTCGITVHFLPCDQIKVTTSCLSYGNPGYPIKNPMYREKPDICPDPDMGVSP